MENDQQSEASRQKPEGLGWRFSLKTLLILLTLFCVWLGTLANRANHQRRAVEAIQLSGGEFNYDYQRVANRRGSGRTYSMRTSPPGPKWLRGILGDHYFITPQALHISKQPAIKDDCLAHFNALPETAMFYAVPFQDRDVAHLKHLKNLTDLTFKKERCPVQVVRAALIFCNIFRSSNRSVSTKPNLEM